MAEPAIAERLYTPEELERMPDASNYELIDGVLTERKVSNEASRTAFELGIILGSYIKANQLGSGYNSDVGLRLWPDRPRHYRRPDLAFIRRERVTDETAKGGFLTVAPDLIVEVVSPSDLAQDVERKIREYLVAGVNLIWVVYTDPRTIRVVRRSGSVNLGEDDLLDGENVLPGFRCRVADIYPDTPVTTQEP